MDENLITEKKRKLAKRVADDIGIELTNELWQYLKSIPYRYLIAYYVKQSYKEEGATYLSVAHEYNLTEKQVRYIIKPR